MAGEPEPPKGPQVIPDEHGLTAGDVARRLGIAVTTLRTWHQRYGLGPSRHAPGRHRRYTEADLLRLLEMRRLTAQGVPPAEAARVVLSPGAPEPRDARAGGGRAIPVGRAEPAARGLAQAAIRLDAPAMLEAMSSGIRRNGVISTWNKLIRPVLVGVGARQAATGELVEVEHLFSRAVSDALATVPRPDGQPARVLLACADDEQHTLPLEALAAALTEAGQPSRLLGARVPPTALRDAVRRTGPAVVIVWSQVTTSGDPQQFVPLVVQRPLPVMLAAAGPGWPDVLPSGIARPSSLRDAVAMTMRVLGQRS